VQTFPHSSGFEIVNETVTASPRPARSTRKSARKRKRHSDLLAPADDNAPRYGDEPAGRYLTTLDGDVTPDQRKPSKKAAATATKRGATSAAHGKSKAPAKSAAVAKSSKNAKGTKSTMAAKSVKGKSAKTSAATAARASSKRSKATASKTTAAKATAAKATAAKATTSKATASKAGTKASIAKSSAAKAPAKSEEAAPVVASRGPIKVSIATAENGKQIITVTGSLPPNRTVSYRYQMKNPPLVIAGMIYDRLRSHGITISGQPTSGVTPAHSRVLAETGRPLAEILHLVMKNSNNFLAEYVFKMIGAAAGGQQETAQKSLEKIQHRMSINHVDFNRCIINDGSGLSRANCLSASALTGILDAAYHDKKIFDAFYPVMSIAGIDGTLRGRMKGTFAQGNVHGKTGTLNNASALSGYVTTRDGEFLCFSMLMNGGNHGAYRAVQDKVAAKLAAFSYAETLASLDK
jgi:PBP4 family serine-type D-alanyl-D-alanine carboxypeptidase